MVKKDIFDFKRGFFSFDLDWSTEENKPTIRLKFWKFGISLNFFWD